MGAKVKFVKDVLEEAKKVPKALWVAAAILPGGFTAIGIYFVVKSVKNKQAKSMKDLINEWKKND